MIEKNYVKKGLDKLSQFLFKKRVISAVKIYTGKWISKKGSWYCSKCCAFIKEDDSKCKVCGSAFTQTEDESKLTTKTFFKRIIVLLTQPLLIFSQFFFMGSPLFLPPKIVSKGLDLDKNTKKSLINELLLNLILLIITIGAWIYSITHANRLSPYYNADQESHYYIVFFLFCIYLLVTSVLSVRKYLKSKKAESRN